MNPLLFSDFNDTNIKEIVEELEKLIKSGFSWVNFNNEGEPEVGDSQLTEQDIYIPTILEIAKIYLEGF